MEKIEIAVKVKNVNLNGRDVSFPKGINWIRICPNPHSHLGHRPSTKHRRQQLAAWNNQLHRNLLDRLIISSHLRDCSYRASLWLLRIKARSISMNSAFPFLPGELLGEVVDCLIRDNVYDIYDKVDDFSKPQWKVVDSFSRSSKELRIVLLQHWFGVFCIKNKSDWNFVTNKWPAILVWAR